MSQPSSSWWMASPPPPLTPTTLALHRLYESTQGASWAFNANWLTGDPCGSEENGNTPWQVADRLPIRCKGGLPSSIFLEGNHLRGTLPTELGLLINPSDSLSLNLRNNHVSGTLPTELGALSATGVLSLRFDLNRLSGAIPSQLGLIEGSSTFCYLSWMDDAAITNAFACPIPAEAIDGCTQYRMRCGGATDNSPPSPSLAPLPTAATPPPSPPPPPHPPPKPPPSTPPWPPPSPCPKGPPAVVPFSPPPPMPP